MSLSIFFFFSTDSGWENPFRPGGDLSREADQIVELIKEGKPITPIPGNNSPKPDEVDTTEVVTKNAINDLAHSPKSPDSKKTNNNQQNANGNTPNDKPSSPGPVEVQRTTVSQPADASQVEHVIIKKKNKCQCCVLQ